MTHMTTSQSPTSASSILAQLTNDEVTSVVMCTPVYSDGALTFKKALGDGSAKSKAIGIVIDQVITSGKLGSVLTVGVATATTAQWDAVCGTSGGLAAGATYYLSASTPGALTTSSASGVAVIQAVSSTVATLKLGGAGSAPIAPTTIAGNNTGSTAAPIGLTDVQAQAVLGIDVLSVKDSTFGAKGDWNPTTGAGTDDRAAFVAAIAAAKSAGKHLRIPPGNYKLSSYIPIIGANGLRIEASSNATIYYGSDDLTLTPDATATSYNMARSAFLFQNCQNVSVVGVNFVGGNSQELTNCNVGVAIYAQRCVGMRVTNCSARYGYALYTQEAATDSTFASGNSLTVASGIVTLTIGGGATYGGMVGRRVTVTSATAQVNNGVFTVLSVPTSSTLTFANASAIAESGTPLVWTVNDGDSDTVLTACRSYGVRGTSYTGPSGVFDSCHFEQPLTNDLTGIPSSVAMTGAVATLTDPRGKWTTAQVGSWIKIGGMSTSDNNGVFQITAATAATQTSPATLMYTNGNAAPASETCSLSAVYYRIAGGERNGIGGGASAISSSSGVVTFTAAASLFRADDVGKTLVITDATSAVNCGPKCITRYISATQVQYVQTGAVSEAYAKVFTVDGYDTTKDDETVGPPIGSTSTAVGANSLTDGALSMVMNAYAGRYLIDHAGRQWQIASNTATVFTLNGGGLTPTAGAYTVSAGATHGSTHAIYYFAGRSDEKVVNCTMRGIRTTGVKVSGSSLPIKDVQISGNLFEYCGAAIIAGADDQQEHVGFQIHHNIIRNCAIGRRGWNDQYGIGVYGARNVRIADNSFDVTHDCMAALVDTGNVGGFQAIFAGRYVAGISRPLEDVIVSGNKFTIDPTRCVGARVAEAAIHVDRVGQRAKYRTGGTLTISGTTMTLTDSLANFTQDDVGSSIQLVNAPNTANNITATVTSVSGTGTLTFANASGVGGGVAAGTYRVKPKINAGGRRGGMCIVAGNQIDAYGSTGIQTVSCVGPEIVDNIFNGLSGNIAESGSVTPRIARNRELGSTTSNARIVLSTGTAWPIIHDNPITNGALSGGNTASDGTLAARRSDMGIGVGSGTAIDHPLLGVRGRLLVTKAKAEVVFAFGSDLVDGDTIGINGTVCTYKTSSPGAGQFNDLASLCALVGSGFVAEEYGTGLSGTPTTGHIRMRLSAAASIAQNGYIELINVLNETALVILRNNVDAGESMVYTVGEGDAGPLAKRLVVWSPVTTTQAPLIQADNSSAAALMAGGWYPEKAAANAGCCTVFKTITTQAGTEEFTWRMA